MAAAQPRCGPAIAGLRARHEWLDHLSRTGERYFQQRGNHFAAAVTFFSVLTAVPLLMVAFGAAGYVLWLNPTLLDDLRDAITDAVPGPLSDAVIPFLDEAVAQRNAVAGLGLLAALWSGIWWTSNLREAVSAQWALPAIRPTSVARFWHDLRVLVVLGVTLLGSISVSVLATGALDVGLARLGLADGRCGSGGAGRRGAACSGWAPASSSSTGCSPGFRARRSRAAGAVRAALVGALGFEVLKQATALSIGSVSGTPGGAVFGPLLGLLLFCYLVARFALLVTAWAATARGNELPARGRLPDPEPAVREPRRSRSRCRARPRAAPVPRPATVVRRARTRCPRRRAGRRRAARRLAAPPRRGTDPARDPAPAPGCSACRARIRRAESHSARQQQRPCGLRSWWSVRARQNSRSVIGGPVCPLRRWWARYWS